MNLVRNVNSTQSHVLRRVENPGDYQSLIEDDLKVPANGYALVFVSNESEEDVYFDELNIVHTRGRLLEEAHYYPDGLKMAGISSLAFDRPYAKQGYQGDFSDYEEDYGFNEFALRDYDPQLGRWTSTDPYDQFASPYVGMGNDWVNNVDPDGGYILGIETLVGQIAFTASAGAILGGAIGAAVDDEDRARGFFRGAAIGAVLGAGVGLGLGDIGGEVVKGTVGTTVITLGTTVASSAVNEAADRALAERGVTELANTRQPIDKSTQTPKTLDKTIQKVERLERQVEEDAGPEDETPWLTVARNLHGTREQPPGSNRGTLINRMLRQAGSDPGQPWCGAFVNHCLVESGTPTLPRRQVPARAFAWENYGSPLRRPAVGAIVILNFSHVGFIAGQAPNGNIVVLGGNQRPGAVTYSPVPRSAIKSMRFPTGQIPNYHLPTLRANGSVLNNANTR